jgi:hypothetical protein
MPFDPYTGEPVTTAQATYHCNLCGQTNPATEQHRHRHFTKREQRHIAAQLRLNRIHANRGNRPTECPICGDVRPPGVAHRCTTKPLDQAAQQAANFEMSGLVSRLKAAGFVVTPKED